MKTEEKIVLPVEMASMVSLKSLIGKLVHKSYSDLMTLTDTLPSMSDVEKKRQILNYTTFVRKQFLKLLALVKWADCADDIQTCQNIMAYLANQNKTFQDTVDYLHKIHVELPAARVRNFDIPTAVDILTTGTYQRMPTKLKDMIPPTPLADEEVLDVFQKMNDTIRVRMLTEEVLPSPMQKYRIENGRIYFSIDNEFEIALTLMGQSHNRRWWIVSLDILVQASTCGGAATDIDISLNDAQKQHLRMNAQKQLIPPTTPEGGDDKPTGLFFPLVNLYDYLHLCCLNMQLEMVHIQFLMLSKTRWLDQLKVQMDQERTKLAITYWAGGSSAAHWARPQMEKEASKSTMIEISVSDEHEKELAKKNMAIVVRDETKGLIQKAGLGASVRLSKVDPLEKPKIVSLLKYPKNCLNVLWGDSKDLHTNANLLNASDLNAEELLLHVTKYHSKCIKDRMRQLLESQKDFLKENGLHLIEDNSNDDESPVIVQYRHDKYINIEVDSRTGKVRAHETKRSTNEGNVKLSGLEERLNNDPENICKHLLWLRSDMVIREIISLAKLLNLQPYHSSQMNLRPEDFTKLFGDFVPTNKTEKFPAHCVFLQFSQFENWYFVLATIKNEFKSWLCCLNIYQAIVDFIYIDCDELRKDERVIEDECNKKRRSEESKEEDCLKKRKTSNEACDMIHHKQSDKVDNLFMDFQYLAKLNSFCRGYITNRKIELQLQIYKEALHYRKRPLLKTISPTETQVKNHPISHKMETICISRQDLLRTCAYYHHQRDGKKKEKRIETVPWIEKLLSRMKNEILIRSFGWWDCDRGECYVVFQDTLDCNNITLQSNDIGDHISLDKLNSTVSFTYANIDTCVDQFLNDWERIFMMINLSRQVPSVWFAKYKDQLIFDPTNLQELSFTYAEHYTCTINWSSSAKGRSRRYDIEFGIVDKNKSTLLVSSNPHWKITTFLRDILNEKRDLIYFVQTLSFYVYENNDDSDNKNNMINDTNIQRTAIFLRSSRKIVLTGSETEEEARAAEKLPIQLPFPRTFDDVHSQRVHMKQKLAAGFRLLAKYGWDEGVAGHMTLRDPEYPDLFWVNAFGQYFGHIKASDLILVDHSGSIVRGQYTVNKAAFVIHEAVHRARSDVICAVHTHSIYGKTFSSFGRKLLPISQDSCAFYNSHAIFEDYGGLVYDKEEGERLVKAIGATNKALILQNHGLLTVGKTVDEAIWWFISMERSCQSQLLAEAALTDGYKGLTVVSDEVAELTHKTVGESFAGYAMFLPLYEMIIKEQPDCLE
ncbi:hypothetical protein G6F29_004223 [Rhizopus arrhizus]|nr:hypothetical protein G6F29_004223 [Rhizopus arrhizus]KAG1100486.1 hypothetical protein G6F39_003958 [Rhizopus arrhizus]